MAEASRPAIRTAWTRGILEYFESHYDADRVTARLGQVSPLAIEKIRGLSDLDWLPIELHVELLEALLSELGPAEFVALYRRSSLELMRGPLLKTTAVAGVRVFGRRAILRVLPKGWNLVVRDCGRLRVKGHPIRNCTDVTLSDMPGVIARSSAIQLCIAAVLAGACDLGGFPGRVQVEREEVRDRTFQYYVSLYGEPEFRVEDPEVQVEDFLADAE